MIVLGELKNMLSTTRTKNGEAVRVTPGTLWQVRIRDFESPGIDEEKILEAVICYQPGNINAYQKGDIVIVAFLNNEINTPIILGKLYQGKENKATNSGYDKDLVVTESARLPMDTKIGDYTIIQYLLESDEFKLSLPPAK